MFNIKVNKTPVKKDRTKVTDVIIISRGIRKENIFETPLKLILGTGDEQKYILFFETPLTSSKRLKLFSREGKSTS